MTIRYDPEVDAAYIPIGRAVRAGEATAQVPEIRSPHGEGEIILDFDEAGHLIGIELLRASTLLRPEDLDTAEHLRP
ncbi:MULTISPECIES: DUF2283 domain-containing protein [unclassified Microbacterium]|uniref:DUF2283 domain-containing protein n=1 Tax=unclassified Microbacterium TaxID=2609290 RepID=UPI0016051DCC|nr:MULTISPECIES: DUF2283 domain-containing protein [unclassified Microbacterium]QNA91361.1 DUF2283 domain-containing protein [Microbacterium sp. Se63.02b]QYM64520.1 DUF2283 domain-containing protein [Microbacterium sp. Se5.02b]